MEYSDSVSSRLKIGVRHALEWLVARQFYRIVTVSDDIRGYIERTVHIAAERLLTLHNGIPVVSRPPERPEREAVTFVSVGRLAAVKNHQLMLRAFHAVNMRHANVRLVIVGDGPERSAIESEIKQKQMEEKVAVLGFRRDVDMVLAEADVFVSPSATRGRVPAPPLPSPAPPRPDRISSGTRRTPSCWRREVAFVLIRPVHRSIDGGRLSRLACRPPGSARSIRKEVANVRCGSCGSGSLGRPASEPGRFYVTGTGATRGVPAAGGR
jgi:hypothetical protein